MKFYWKGRNSRDLLRPSPHDPSEPLSSIPITVPNGFYEKLEGLEEILACRARAGFWGSAWFSQRGGAERCNNAMNDVWPLEAVAARVEAFCL